MDIIAIAVAAYPAIAPYVPYATAGIAACAALATSLPKPTAPGPYATFYGMVNFIACNFGKAKNA